MALHVLLLAALLVPAAEAATCGITPTYNSIITCPDAPFAGRKIRYGDQMMLAQGGFTAELACLFNGTFTGGDYCTFDSGGSANDLFGTACKCECPITRDGARCEELGAICEGEYECLNGGTCSKYRKCSCNYDWTGDQCQTPVCTPACSEVGGSCDASNTCVCKELHIGTTCSDCVDGYFPSDANGSCIPKTSPGYCDTLDVNATYNSVSTSCECTRFDYYGERCQVVCPLCSTGYRQVGGCLQNSGVVCSACSKCGADTFAAGGCDGTTADTICQPCSSCPVGTFFEYGCSGALDRVCSECNACPEGYYASGGCDGLEDNICSPCSASCPNGMTPFEECTGDHDLVCEDCPACPRGTVVVRSCNETHPQICKGTITLPDLPALGRGEESEMLAFRFSSVVTEAFEVVIAGRGLEIIFNGTTNFDANDALAAAAFNETYHSRTLPVENGTQRVYFKVKYHTPASQISIRMYAQGSGLRNYFEVDQNRTAYVLAQRAGPSVFDQWGTTSPNMPRGNNAASLPLLPTNFVLWGSDHWTEAEDQSYAFSCAMVTMAMVSPAMDIPLSITGVTVTVKPTLSFSAAPDDQCHGRRLSDLDMQDLVLVASLPRTFLDLIMTRLPPWLEIEAQEGKLSQGIGASDERLSVMTGAQLVQQAAASEFNVQAEDYYIVLDWLKPSVMTVEGEAFNVDDMDTAFLFCLALTGVGAGDQVFFNIPSSVWELTETLTFRDLLSGSGYEVERTDVAFSQASGLTAPVCSGCVREEVGGTKFWNGDDTFVYPVPTFDFYWSTVLTKTLFDVGDPKTASMSVDLTIEAQTGIKAANTYLSLDNMFNARWEAYAEGTVSIDLEFSIFKKTGRWTIETRAMVYASLDGSGVDASRIECGSESSPKGIFVTADLALGASGLAEKISSSAVGQFLMLTPGRTAPFYFYIPYKSEIINGELIETAAGFGFLLEDVARVCIMPGLCGDVSLDFIYADKDVIGNCDPLKAAYERLPEGKAVVMRGNFDRGTDFNPKLFYVPQEASVRVALATSEFAFVSQITAIWRFLGLNIEATLAAGYSQGVAFLMGNAVGKLFDYLEAEVNIQLLIPGFTSSTLIDLSSMSMSVDAVLRADLTRLIVDAVTKLLNRLNELIMGRIRAALKVVEDIIAKLQALLDAIGGLQGIVDAARAVWDAAISTVESWQRQVENAKKPINDARDEIRALEAKINSICSIRSCGSICIPGCRWESRRRRDFLAGPVHGNDGFLPSSEQMELVHAERQMRGNVSYARIYHANGTTTDRRDVEEFAHHPVYPSRARRMLQEHRRGTAVNDRVRRWSCCKVPKFVCRWCMWRIPDPICVAANALCVLIRAPLYFLLRVIDAFLIGLLAVLEVVEKALELAKIILEKSQFLLDAAEAILEKALAVFDVLQVAVDIARAAAQLIEDAVSAALNFLTQALGNLDNILSIPEASFGLTIKGFVPRQIRMSLQIRSFVGNMGFSIKFDFADVLSSIAEIATRVFDSLFGSFFRRRRRALSDVHVPFVASAASQLNIPLDSIFYHEKSRGAPHMYSMHLEDVHAILRSRRDIDNSTNFTLDAVERTRNDTMLLYNESCEIFELSAAFLLFFADQVEQRYLELQDFKEGAIESEAELNRLNEDPTVIIPDISADGFDDDPAVQSLVVGYIDETNLTAMADNITATEEVTEAMSAANASRNNTAELQASLEDDDYRDLIASLQLELNSTAELVELGCEDVGDCIVFAVGQMADLWAQVELEAFAGLDNASDIMQAYANNLTNVNLTIDEAHEFVQEILTWVNETMHGEVWCGEVPTIVSQPEPTLQVYSLVTVNFTCEVTGIPEPTVYWYRYPEDVEYIATGPTLYLEDVTASDSGSYYCTAVNHMWTETSDQVNLTVIGGQSTEIVVYYQFAESDIAAAVGSDTSSFAEAVRLRAVSSLGLYSDQVSDFNLNRTTGFVSHGIVAGSQNLTQAEAQSLAIDLRDLIRYSRFLVTFNETSYKPLTNSFRYDYCRTPCLAIQENSIYGEPCMVAPASGCPAAYSTQQGASDVCRASHEHSGFDRQVYCRRLNDPPFGISFSGNLTVDENTPANTVLGYYSAKDTDPAQTLTYSLTSGATALQVDSTSGRLVMRVSPNYELQRTLTGTLRVTDSGGYYTDKAITVTVRDVNEVATDIVTLSALTVRENSAAGTLVGIFSSLSEEKAQTYTYAVSGVGATYFHFTGNQLKTTSTPIDYEALNGSITVNVTSTDSGTPPMSLTKAFAVNIEDRNDPPVLEDIECVPAYCNGIPPEAGVGTVVAQIVATDQDAGDVLTYLLEEDESEGVLGVNASTGEIYVKRVVTAQTRYVLEITVGVQDDGSPLGVSEEFVFEVVNLSPTTTTTTTTTTSTTSTSTTSTTTTSTTTTSTSSTSTTTTSTTSTSTTSTSTTSTTTTSTTTFFSTTTTTTTTANVAPTNLRPTSLTVNEDATVGRVLVSFSVTDGNPEQSHTYRIVSGGQGYFAMQGSSLVLQRALDYESGTPSFSLLMEVVDNGKNPTPLRQRVTVIVRNVNEAPTLRLQRFSGLFADSNSLYSLAEVDQQLGTIVVTDPDAGDSHRASVSGTDGAFIRLRELDVFLAGDISGKTQLSFSLTVTDAGGLSATNAYEWSIVAAPSNTDAGGAGSGASNSTASRGSSGVDTTLIVVAVVVFALIVLGTVAYVFVMRRRRQTARMDFLEKLKQEHLEKRKQSSQTPRWFAEEMEDSQSLHRRDSNRVADDEYLAMLGRSLTMDVAETNADAAGGGKDELFDLDMGDDDEATEVPLSTPLHLDEPSTSFVQNRLFEIEGQRRPSRGAMP
ncbi:uncharacterized protein MONBRDRAFT_33537 [Monosiga brevicollis MX1]|uniref:Uncharacterized protein n=1 Tax=Monosiga brevicollis TaxID=81824 RepID=A9V5Y4_MONBE|nr:uncharacterized protein MONBRDRAFT_33537 [Monosiga brevicollis MX1]EDQ87190.1 predicted protein [Monosiga brevicollis MX1]|eukprot:XP_001748133.1 hypothetical protein [Monosiga brevicollis MX1]